MSDPRPVLVLCHGAGVPPGYLGEVLAERGVPLRIVDLAEGGELPEAPLSAWSAVVSLGGRMGAYEEEAHPFLAVEKRYLRRAVEAGRPVLGICLGCQLLAEALGGRAYRADRPEVGLVEVRGTEAGRGDALLARLDRPVLAFHEDSWETPPGAVLTAVSDGYRHAFRRGSALGLQAHPEASPEIVRGWIESGAGEMVERAERTAEGLLTELEAERGPLREMALSFFAAWWQEVAGGEGRGLSRPGAGAAG